MAALWPWRSEAHHRVFQQIVFPNQLSVFGSSPDTGADHVRLKGFGEEIEGTLAHALHGKLNRGNRGEHNDGDRWIRFTRCGQHRQTLSIGHSLVGDHHVKHVG